MVTTIQYATAHRRILAINSVLDTSNSISNAHGALSDSYHSLEACEQVIGLAKSICLQSIDFVVLVKESHQSAYGQQALSNGTGLVKNTLYVFNMLLDSARGESAEPQLSQRLHIIFHGRSFQRLRDTLPPLATYSYHGILKPCRCCSFLP